MRSILEQARLCRAAAPALARLSSGEKDAALLAMADALEARSGDILAANAQDLARAQAGGMSPAFLDRLALTRERVLAMAGGLRQVAALPDPVGQVVEGRTLPNGLRLTQVRVPLGVVGIIYEARPNVTSDAAGLCLKAGNAVLLRGGRDALGSSLAVGAALQEALAGQNLPAGAVQVVEDAGRESAQAMMGLTEYLDVLIPRGGRGLIRSVAQQARVPVIRTGEGVCHIYVHAAADLPMALSILLNAKCSSPSVCNAAECVLVDASAAPAFWALAAPALCAQGVALRCDEATLALLPPGTQARRAVEEDWDTEYNALTLACRQVSGLEEALAFLDAHSSGHSEAIVTRDYDAARRFLREVDAAAVYVNASTRFTDGGEFGLGAELGISTQKLHARGPMGLSALTSTKFLVEGQGQIRP